MQVAIRPIDVWLFRDGKPFTAGEDHTAETLFPPSPFTLQGAIRAKVLADKGINLAEFAKRCEPDPDVGYGDNFGKLRLRGPLLMRCKSGKWERLIRMPADVVKVGDCYDLLRPNFDLPFATNLPNGLQLLWAQTVERVEDAKGWLPESEWQNYLQGKAPERVLRDDELFAFEPRFGIAVDKNRRTAREGMLYQARFVRLKDEVALWAEVNILKSERGFLRFGGESKAAIYEPIDQLPDLESYWQIEKRFKVVLVTPAWFSGGWRPKDGDWSKILGTKAKLVATLVQRHVKFGGFDVAKGVPKPMRAFVPAGSVYFFEAEKSFKPLEDFAFTETPKDFGDDWGKIGLGMVLIGRW